MVRRWLAWSSSVAGGLRGWAGPSGSSMRSQKTANAGLYARMRSCSSARRSRRLRRSWATILDPRRREMCSRRSAMSNARSLLPALLKSMTWTAWPSHR